ncbi:MAG TPA: hypothetical protein VFR67_15050 [Pilimelia sp.]|nr:hypothetical protein [Pilimelia sp.]
MIVAEPLTDADRRTLKTAAFGAVYLVSNADPGLLDMLRESFAASGSLAGSSEQVRGVLTTGPLPILPRHPPEAVEATVLPALRESVEILRRKAPEELETFREVVLDAAARAAGAAGGFSEAEAAARDKIRDALAGVESR